MEGPKVKERKKFAPPTKVEKPKKGKGSYNRRETFDESRDISNFIDSVRLKEYSKADAYLKKLVEDKILQKIKKELKNPLF